MNRYIIASAIVFASMGSAQAAPDTYTIDGSHTYPSFEINHLGFSTQRGRFDTSTGTIILDIAAKKGSINVDIDTASLSTGWAKRDEHLRSKDFFNTEKFPKMSYKSSELTFDGDKLVGVKGELTLLGVTKPVDLKVENFHCGKNPISKKDACGAEAKAVIRRSEFGMGAYVPAVGDDVTLMIQVEATK